MQQNIHPLKNEWKFWVRQIKWEGKSRQYEIEPICTFNTVEAFWNNFIQLPSIKELQKGGISLFKNGIQPAWEDPKNADGQSVMLAITDWTQELWEKLILKIVGGTLEEAFPEPFFCGMYAKMNQHGLTVELWFGPGEFNVEKLAKFLEIDSTNLQLKQHPKN